MSKTVHPYSFRLGIMRGWKSRWFNLGNYRKLLKTDVMVREHLEKKMKGLYVEAIEIERNPALMHVIVRTSRPGLVIGRQGEGSKKIRDEILKVIKKIGTEEPRELKISVEEVLQPDSHAKIISHMIVENLEKRMPFRRVVKQAIEKIMANREVKGAKIALSGRLGGADMSRREVLKKGRIPLQTLRADIDFARNTARMSYGAVGVKVWIFKEA